MNVWIKRAAIAVPVVVALFFGAVLLYVNVIRDDAPAELGTDDLSAAVSPTTAPPASTPTTSDATHASAPTTTGASGSTTAPGAAAGTTAGTSAYDGTWAATPDSVFGYRVEEVLFGVNTEGVGRGSDITGELVIDGATVTSAAFTVDVASILSDDERRDTQFRGPIMEIEQFPDATFTLTAPIELANVPAPGTSVTARATGDLTLHGVTQAVTFDVTAEAGDGRIGVLGNIPVTFADYDIDNPSRGGITTEDHGLLEFVLVFEPA